ncbi:MAG: C40 family peptidase [Dysgonomonas sp.]
MNYAINKKSISAIRTEANHSSEMTSQLLFGEYCKVISSNGDFYEIENCLDKHSGWITKDSLFELNEEDIKALKTQPNIRICEPIVDVFCLTDKTIYRFPAGSLISNFDPDTSKFELAGKTFQIHPSFISYLPQGNPEGIIPTALSFLNTPYLAGGKNLLGMDCSGFAQTVYSINGYILPRFSAQQAETGKTIDNLTDAEVGDLLFFRKEDTPSHTAIYMGNNKIIHARDIVCIEDIDDTGFNLSGSKYNRYQLYKITRVI